MKRQDTPWPEDIPPPAHPAATTHQPAKPAGTAEPAGGPPQRAPHAGKPPLPEGHERDVGAGAAEEEPIPPPEDLP